MENQKGSVARRPAMLVALVAILLSAPVALALLGDVDADGSVTSADAALVLEALVGSTTLTAQQEADADVDGTGTVDVKDALLIRQYAAGNLAAFPPRLPQNSGPIVLSRKGDVLGVVNPDSDSVTFVDTADDAVILELAVGRDPQSLVFSRDGRKVYVTNARDASVSIVDTRSWSVTGSIDVGVEPFGIAINFRGDRAYVANFASETVSIIDTATDEVVETLAVAPKPQGLGINRDSSTVFVTHLNGREVSIVDTATSVVSNLQLSEIPFDAPNPTQPAGNFNRMKGIALHPTEDRAWLPAILSNNGNFIEAVFNTTIFPVVGVLDTAGRTEVVGERMTLFSGFSTVVSEPEAAAFSPDGSRVYVICSASNDLVVMNSTIQQEIGLIRDVGDNPRGIAITQDGTRAYVFNRLTPEISVVDLTTEQLVGTIPVSTDPLPPNLANGRRLLFTSALPEVAGDRFFGCEACHFDGRDDGRTWFFTNGPRQTIGMEGGTLNTGLLHHTGDRADVQDFASAFTRLQNGTGLTEDQLDDLADFVNFGIRRFENPFLNPDGSHTDAARRGRRLFRDPVTQCSTCHSGAFLTDAEGFTDPSNPKLHDVGIFAEGLGQPDPTDQTRDQDGIAGGTLRPAGSFESTFLLGAWATGPWLHDGRSPSLQHVVGEGNPSDLHGVTSHLTTQEQADLARYMQELHISKTRVRIDHPADAARVADLLEVSGNVLPDVVSVEVLVDGAGPIAATVDNGRFTAVVPAPLVPALADGSMFDVTATALTETGEPGRDDVEVEVNYGGVADPATSTVDALPGVIAADGVSFAKLLISPRDSGGRLVGTGLSIEVQTTAGTLSAVLDNGDGTYTVALTSEITVGTATVSANVAGGPTFLDAATVTFAAGTADPIASSVLVSPSLLEADGISTAVATVVPRDAFGNTLGGGQTVTIAADVGTMGSTVDQGDGTYTATFVSATSTGLATVSATANGTALNATPMISLVADVTAPSGADLQRITFGTPSGGISQIIGGQLAVEPFSTVRLENTTTAALTTTTAAADGTFVTSLAVTTNDQVCIRLEDLATNVGPTVCTVPFPVSVFAVSGKLQQAVAGGGFAPMGGELVQLFSADVSNPASPSFDALFIDNDYLTDTTQSDGRYQILLPNGFVPDPDLAVVWGTDTDMDGSIDTIDRHALVNDISRSVTVDELSSDVIFLIALNDTLLGPPDPCAPDFTGPCPVEYFTPQERTDIEATLRDATTEVDFTTDTAAQLISNDVFFDVDGAKNATDQIAYDTFLAAARSPGVTGPPLTVSGTVTVPGASGDVPLSGVTVQLGTLSINPLNVSVLSGTNVVTDGSGNYTVQLPSFVSPGSSLVAVVAGDLTYDGTGVPGPFTTTSDLSIAGWVLDTTGPADVDLAGRVSMSLIEFASVPLENFSAEELDELVTLVRSKLAAAPPALANLTLAQVFVNAFNAMAVDLDVLNLVLAIADPESGAGNSLVTANPTTLEADGVSRSVITIEPLDANSERVGPGLFVTLSTTAGTVTSPAIDNHDGTYTAYLLAPTSPVVATVSATVDGMALAMAPDVTFTADLTAPAAPDADRIVVTSIGASTVTVIGLPSAVEARCDVTIDNVTQGGSVTVRASKDGSFRIDLSATGGDELAVRCTDGSGNASGDTTVDVVSAVSLPLIANTTGVPGGATVAPRAQTDLGVAIPAGYLYLRGFSLDLGGQTASVGLDVVIETQAAVPAGQQLVLAQVVKLEGVPQLRVVAPARADGGVLSPIAGAEFPGAREEGDYVYLSATAPIAFIHGDVSGDRGAIRSVRVGLDTSPFVDLTRGDGRYLLAGPANSDTRVAARLYRHTAGDEQQIFLPFAGSISECDFALTTRADEAFGFTGRFADLGQIAEQMKLTPSGGRLYVGLSSIGDISIVDTDAMQPTSFTEDAQQVMDLAFTPNGFEAFIAYFNRVRDFTISIEEPGLLLQNLGFPQAIAIAPDGDEAVVASSLDNATGDANPDALFFVDTFSNLIAPVSLSIEPDPIAIRINRAGTRAYVAGRTALTVIDLDARTVLDTVPLGTVPSALALTPDGTRLFVADALDNEVRAFDAALAEDAVPGNELLATIAVGQAPSALAVSPDGTTLLVTEQNDDTLSVIDVAALSVSAVWAAVNLPADVTIHPDGRHAYVLDPILEQGVLEIPLAANDLLSPIVIDVGPEDRIGIVLQDSPVEAVFSEAMDTSLFTPIHVKILDENDQPIAGSLAPAGDGVTVIFTPDPGVRYLLNSTLTMVLETGLTDKAGQPLSSRVERIVPTVPMQLPNPALISADLSTAGVSVNGAPGAVEPLSKIEVTNLTSGIVYREDAAADGSFSMMVQGLDTDGFELITKLFAGRAKTDSIPVPINFSIVIPDPSRISYQAGPAGTLLATGAAGAVDPQSSLITIRNLTTDEDFTTTAINPDGSFTVEIFGASGDSFELVSEILGAFELVPVPMAVPVLPVPALKFISPDSFTAGEAVSFSIVGTEFGTVKDEILFVVDGEARTDYVLDTLTGSATDQVIQFDLPAGSPSGQVQLFVRGQQSNKLSYFAVTPPNTSVFVIEVVEEDVIGDSQAILGSLDQNYVDLGPGGSITVQVGSSVDDGLGNDFQIFEDQSDGQDCYRVFVATAASGPFTEMTREYCGTSFVNLDGHPPIRYIRIVDMDDGGPPARIDAIFTIRVQMSISLLRMDPDGAVRGLLSGPAPLNTVEEQPIYSMEVDQNATAVLKQTDGDSLAVEPSTHTTLRYPETVVLQPGAVIEIDEDPAGGPNCVRVLGARRSVGPFRHIGESCGGEKIVLPGKVDFRFLRLAPPEGSPRAARIDALHIADAPQPEVLVTLDEAAIAQRLSRVSVTLSPSTADICVEDELPLVATVSPPPQAAAYYGAGCDDTYTWNSGGQGALTRAACASPMSCNDKECTFCGKDMQGRGTVTVTVRRAGNCISGEGSATSAPARIDINKVDLEGFKPGTRGSPGAMVSESAEDDPMNLPTCVNDDRDDDPMLIDNANTSIGAADDEIVKITMKKLQSMKGTVTLTVPGATRAYNTSGSAPLGGTSLDLASPSGDLAGLASGDLDLWLEGMSVSPDATVKMSYASPDGSTCEDEVHLNISKVQLNSITFTSDHGLLNDGTDVRVVGSPVPEPEWDSSGANHPITHTLGSTAGDKIEARVNFDFMGIPSGTSYTLRGMSSESALNFTKSGTVSAGTVDIDVVADFAPGTAIRKIDEKIEWEIELLGKTMKLGETGSHVVYLTLGTPDTSAPASSSVPNIGRMDVATSVAAAAASAAGGTSNSARMVWEIVKAEGAYNLGTVLSDVNSWLLPVTPGGADCFSISKFVRNVGLVMGIPGTFDAEIYAAYYRTPGDLLRPNDAIAGLDLNTGVFPGTNGPTVPGGLPGFYQLGLADANCTPPGGGPAGTVGCTGGLNAFEAAVIYVDPGGTTWYFPGGTNLVYDTEDRVVQIFQTMSWLAVFDHDSNPLTPDEFAVAAVDFTYTYVPPVIP